jgi:transglutaminase-like putative cysteine protease
MYRQERLFRLRKVKPGDKLDYVNYELALGAPLTVRATVKGPEVTDVLEAGPGKDAKVTRVPKKLVRVETRADKVKVGAETIELPMQVVWLDPDLLPVRYEQEFPGVGRFTLYRTTKEAAQEKGVAPELLPDLGLNSIVRLKSAVDKPHETREAVWRITLKGDVDPAKAFARDARQQVRNVKGKTFELHVKAVREPVKVDKPGAVGKEYLESSYFLDCDKLRLKVLAGRLTRGEDDDWRKAQKIEKWVHANMRGSNEVGFARASQVALDLAGDCRQHAMLTAALCRAAKVPARTAVGLVYGEGPDGKPALIFHMWTEVWVKGQWLGLDATLGRGGIGACHLKVADHSWRDTQTLAPLLPVARILGKLSVEVVRAR